MRRVLMFAVLLIGPAHAATVWDVDYFTPMAPGTGAFFVDGTDMLMLMIAAFFVLVHVTLYQYRRTRQAYKVRTSPPTAVAEDPTGVPAVDLRFATISLDMMRVRKRSVALCQRGQAAVVLSQEMRVQTRQLRQQVAREFARHQEVRREHLIARRLLTCRLPHVGPPTVMGASGAGGNCDGCDKPLMPTQLVMELPLSESTFVHLHADCFMIWNALRPLRKAVA